MKARSTRRMLNRLALMSVLMAGNAVAQQFSFDLPAQPMANALTALAQQSQLQVLFNEAELEALRAPALLGSYTPEEALQHLLLGSGLELVPSGDGYVIRARESDGAQLELEALSVVGNGYEVDSSNVGRSTLTQAHIERQQADNIPSLLQTLPGVSMGGSPKPGGQTMNIWGLGDAEDVPFTVDGATKSGFERYQQGTVFIEPELIKRIEVEKGPHSVYTGNGGFGGTVHMETKDATDLLQEGRNVGAMLKYGYHSNDQQKIYSGAVYGQSDGGMVDSLLYLTGRDGRDIKLADNPPVSSNITYPINPKRLPNTAQDLDAGLFKLNLHPNEEHDFGLSWSRSKTTRWTPFSSASYPTPPTQSNINQYGYEAALRRFLAHRDTTDTTWSTKYNYHPLDNPLVDLMLNYSQSDVEQLDEREPTAFVQVSTGGRRMHTEYTDKLLELRNTSRFETYELSHALTTGLAWRRHNRDTLMYIPGNTYNNANYNYGWFQPTFMPSGEQVTQSFYLQDAISYGNLTVTPSMRFDSVRNDGDPNLARIYNNAARGHDYSSQTYSGWSPRLSLFWTATDQVGLFADYTETWRAPVIDEQYEVQNSTTRPSTSRDLDPERIQALRAGSVISLPNLIVSGDNLQIRTTLFRNHIKDEIFKNTGVGCEAQSASNGTLSGSCGSTLPQGNYRNIGDLTIKGFEVESFYDSGRMFGALSYSWMTGEHEGAYTNPWGPDVWARDIPPAKWVATVGVKIPEIDAQVGWQGEFVRKTDRLPSDKYSGGMGSSVGDVFYDQYDNASYDTQRIFADWKPQQGGLKGTEVNFTVDNLFNRFYRPALSGDRAYAQGRNAKISITRFF
ncbi:TonB-dependent receptor [Pseudomonas sp. ML96]|uniref:TonB-dependent receptor n=1 Tax=Pseudomonas sp. ML96 TaxID=1523503 RepID=UPI000689EAA2